MSSPVAERVATLLAGMESDDATVREEAAGDVRKLEKIPPRAVTALIRALGDEVQDVRIAAAESLEFAASKRAVKPLLALLPRALANPRWFKQAEVGAILGALGAAGSGEPEVIRAILSTIDVPQAGIYASLAAFEALRALGPRAAMALPALEPLLAHAQAWMRVHARATTLAIDGRVDVHAPALVDWIGDDDVVAGIASDALCSLGPRVVPILRAAAKHRRKRVRDEARRLLAQLSAG